MGKGQHRAHRRAVRSVVAIASIVALQAAGSLHYVLIEHERCAAHGEMTHGGSGHTSPDTREAHHGGLPHDGDAAHAVATERDAHGHEHCPAATERREDAVLASSGGSIALFVSLSERSLDGITVASPQAPLRYAPKTSPPV